LTAACAAGDELKVELDAPTLLPAVLLLVLGFVLGFAFGVVVVGFVGFVVGALPGR
jgi:hypothetical protein